MAHSFSPGRYAPGGDTTRGHHATRSTELYAGTPGPVKSAKEKGDIAERPARLYLIDVHL